jgi:hypothetical protein
MSELRRHLRKAVKVEFVCHDEAGLGELVFDSADLSTGGAFLVSDMLFEQGEVLGMAFVLPGGSTIRCESRVAWVRRFPAKDEAAGMGLEFVGLAEFDRRALESFLDQ